MTFWSWDICTGAPRPPARPRPPCSRAHCTHAAHLARPALRRRAARMAQIRAPSAEISCTSRVSRPKPVRRCLLCTRAAALLCRQTPPAPPAWSRARTPRARSVCDSQDAALSPPTAPLPPAPQTRASPTTPATASRGAAAGTSSTWTASHAGSRRARSARSATASGSLRRSRRSRPTATSTECERGASWRPGGRACRRQRARSAL